MSKDALVWMILALTGAAAQTGVTTLGTTTPGYVTVLGPNSKSTATNPPITVSGGDVGIGPTELEV
jgi:hypothetical protein